MQKINLKSVFVLGVILIVGLAFNYKHINKPPSKTHAWAQSDRYAMALRFSQGNSNLFTPETFLYNHQFPHNWERPEKHTVTAVDFPIHDYIVGNIMKFTGVKKPWIFRLYTLLYSCIGLLFLYKLANLYLRNPIHSLFITLFTASSPLFLYYQCNFLPSIPSFANCIIGFYFYFKFRRNSCLKYFYTSIFFLTLATLNRTSFLMPLLSILGVEFLQIIQGKSNLKSKILPVLLSLGIIASYFTYNSFLRNNYGSLFLNELLVPKNIEVFFNYIKRALNSWGFDYLSMYHYIAIALLVLFVILKKIQDKTKKTPELSPISILILLLGVVNLLFLYVLAKQFIQHDYYFIDSFFLVIILGLIKLFSYFPILKTKKSKIIYWVILIFFTSSFLLNGIKSNEERYKSKFWDLIEKRIDNYKNSEKILDSLGITPDKKILTLETNAPNLGLLLMNRKGYCVMSNKKERLEKALEWKYDYIVFQNELFLTEIHTFYPEIITKIKKIYDNGKISVCKRKDNNEDLLSFLNLKNKKSFFNTTLDFESSTTENWHNITPSKTKVYSGDHSTLLTDSMNYGITFIKNFTEFNKKGRTIYCTGQFYQNSDNYCDLVLSIQKNGENIFYRNQSITGLIQKKEDWNKLNFIFNIPIIDSPEVEVRVFISNYKSTLYVDNFNIQIY